MWNGGSGAIQYCLSSLTCYKGAPQGAVYDKLLTATYGVETTKLSW